MRQRGRPVLGAVSGFFLGLFVGLDLLFFGVVPLDSVVLTVLPLIGLLLGLALGVAAPLGRSGGRAPSSSPAAPPPPPPPG